MPNTVKYLKILVFGGSRWYLVIFGFANSHFKNIWYFGFENSHFKSIWKNLDLVFIGSRKPNNISKFLPWISDRFITLRIKIHVLMFKDNTIQLGCKLWLGYIKINPIMPHVSFEGERFSD